MAINGRINVDVLFHDTYGTASLKVVSLDGSSEYTTGKVAIVSGTVGTTAVNLWSQNDGIGFGGYKDSGGQDLSIGAVTRIALRSPSVAGVQVVDIDQARVSVTSKSNELSVASMEGATHQIKHLGSGTASFVAVLYGET